MTKDGTVCRSLGTGDQVHDALLQMASPSQLTVCPDFLNTQHSWHRIVSGWQKAISWGLPLP